MACDNHLEHLIRENRIESALRKGSTDREGIKALQQLLHELGFGKELKWEQFGADGYYGNATVAAVQTFIGQHGLQGDGTNVKNSVAGKLLALHDSLDELQQLHNDLKADQIDRHYKRGSHQKIRIAALQTLLNDLGYGEQLKWDRYKNDGDYGGATSAAVRAFANDHDIEIDGGQLSKSLAGILIEEVGRFYGSRWRETGKTVPDSQDDGQCALTSFSASNFVGKKVIADVQFTSALHRINRYAMNRDVLVHVTSSFRTTTNVAGAIVTPAKMSNHLAGHAIDMNLRYGPGHNQWANSSVLGQTDLPAPVAAFIQDIRDDDGLRWGGDFNTPDTVHIDDHLNKDRAAWEARYQATQEARRSGCG